MGRIGKPQKSKKHKKVKPLDAIKQVETGSRRGVVNRKPQSLEQEIPKKALMLMATMKGEQQLSLLHHAKTSLKRKKKKRTNKFSSDSLSKLGDEGQNSSSKQREEEQRMKEKFKLDREGDIVTTNRAQKKKMRAKEHKQRKKDKLKEKELEKERDFSQFKDEVKFGDIVHAPPSLSTLPRKAQTEQGTPRPGKKSLLLKEIITTNTSHNQGLASAGTSSRRQLGQSVKRKDLSLAQQQRMDFERGRAIELYRKMKIKKIKDFS